MKEAYNGRDALLEVCSHLAAERAPEEVRECLAGAWLVASPKDNLGVNTCTSGGRDALLEVCSHLAAGRAPEEVREWLAGARLVALLKDNLGVSVRTIACGELLRKLVAKIICKQCAKASKGQLCGWRQDAEHGGPLGPLYLAAPLQTLLEWFQEGHPKVVIFNFLDDAFFMGPSIATADANCTYMETAPIGLDIQWMESAAFLPEGDASCFADGMPGVPPKMMREAAEGHERRMQEAQRDLLPSDGLAWNSYEFITLPHRMGLTKVARVTGVAWFGQHVLFDVATARPMLDAHLGTAMMPPGAAARKVEESKVVTYGDVHPHQFVPFGVEVYGKLRGGPERRLGGGEMARVARGVEVSRLQRHGSSAPAVQVQNGSGVARLAEVGRLQRHNSTVLAGQPQRGSGGPVRLREQRGGPMRELGGGDMARAARGAGMNWL
ncbi:hypothetical protein CYMTET_21006 [Cymbomonas tetramitiformis]|uniref:Uncharacterized protein n=1 Tax=Cymbomonas tetramitiformis TaxID=36881 RepID=A0AAE0L3A9_9CHLO|nr:hypothetical protein CYMTET_21006 [Cymbomonas tetramitiformis]